jgi:replicative DNA helicase
VRLQRFRKVLANRAAELKDDLARRARGETVLTHIPTGLASLDKAFGGIERGVQTLVIGHTGDGKTTVVQNLVEGAARNGVGVAFFVLEDPERKVADKAFAKELGISANLLGRLEVDLDVPARLDAALEGEHWSDNVAFHSGMADPDEILEVIGKLARTGVNDVPLGLVAVDYAQGFSDVEESLEAVCGRMARNLNILSGTHNLATLFGSQCKTAVMPRGRSQWERTGEVDGYRPGRGDAMWSARLEQYSKAVWTIFRPGRWRQSLGDTAARDDRIELNVVKANFGPEGQVVLGWEGKTGRVYDIGKAK